MSEPDERPRKRYKRYTYFEFDDGESLRIPRTTLWRHRELFANAPPSTSASSASGLSSSNLEYSVISSELNSPSSSSSERSSSRNSNAAVFDSPIRGASPDGSPSNNSSQDSSDGHSEDSSDGHSEDSSDGHPADSFDGHPADSSNGHSDDSSSNMESSSSSHEFSHDSIDFPNQPNVSGDDEENSYSSGFDEPPAGAIPDDPTYHHERLFDKYLLDSNITLSSNLSRWEVLVLVFKFAMRFGLTSVGIEALLKLINTVLGDPLIPPTKYHFEKIFSPAPIITFHLYCPVCGVYLSPAESFNEPNCPVCNAAVSKSTNDASTNFFLQLSLRQQIKARLENDGDKIINYRRQRTTKPERICDIFDADVFRHLTECGMTDDDITISINLDGANKFKSSKNSLWPQQVRINEIPPNERFSAENLILTGLWFGRKEINITSYMVPLIIELKHLVSTGINWYSPARNEVVNTKVYLSTGIEDTPAKAKMMNMKNFNGKYGCYVCPHPGTAIDQNNQIRYSDTVQYPDRTDAEVRRDMRIAHETGNVTNGFKDASPLLALPYIKFPLVFSIDIMHSHLLGVVKYLWTNLWTNSSLHEEPFYLEPAKVKAIDRRIKAMKPPSDISRDPRPISLDAFYKANEWRTWVFFYGPLCLKDILPNRFYNHFCLLSCSLFLLSQEEIKRDDIPIISNYLNQFTHDFEILYGLQYMTYNVHITKHVTSSVLYSGPIWGHTAFPYEGGNGWLLALILGSMGVPQQIARKYATLFYLPELLQLHPPLKDQVVEYCDSIAAFSRFKKFSSCDDVIIKGDKFKHKFIPSPIIQELMAQQNMTAEDAFEVMTIIFCGSRFSSVKAKSARNDTLVKLRNGMFAQINSFFVKETQADDLFAVVREILISGQLHRTFKSQVNVCEGYMYGNFSIIRVREILRKCVFILLGEENYAIELPNKFEKD